MFTGLICAIIALISTLSFCVAIVSTIVALTADVAPPWYKVIILLWFTTSPAADIMITISMMILLFHAKANSYFEDTRDLLSRLIRTILQTGLLTSLLALIVLPLYLKNFNGIYGIPWFVLGKSYVISLLANLNARKQPNTSVVRGIGINQATHPTKLSTVVFSPANRHNSEGGNSDSMASSPPIHSVVQMSGLDGSINNADVTEEYKPLPVHTVV